MKKILSNQAVKKFMHNRKAVLGLIIVCFLVLAVILIPIFMKLDPYTTDRAVGFNKAPCSGHPLGTDDVGRDLFARLLYGGRISLLVGIMSTIISVLIGIPLGLIAGYFRGIAETVIMRVADAFMSFPTMVLILVLVAVFGPSILTVTVVIGVLGWTAIAKLIYGNVLSIREREYIQATKAIGMSTPKILLSEVLPNAIPPVWANFNRILVKLSWNGCPDTTGILGKYHICSAESSCIDGTSVGVVPTGNLHHSRCCGI